MVFISSIEGGKARSKNSNRISISNKQNLELIILKTEAIKNLIKDLVENAELWDAGIEDLSSKGRILEKLKSWLITEKSLGKSGIYKIIPKAKFDQVSPYLIKFSKKFKRALFSFGTVAKSGIKAVKNIPLLGVIVTCIDTTFNGVMSTLKNEGAAKVLSGVVLDISKALFVTGATLAITSIITAVATSLLSSAIGAAVTYGTVSVAAVGLGAAIAVGTIPAAIVIGVGVIIGMGVAYSIDKIYSKYSIEDKLDRYFEDLLDDIEKQADKTINFFNFLNTYEGVLWLQKALSGSPF